ncbi:class I lanthipeptide [Pedobacter sp. MR2016-19]|uniref:class I lanthipeptide n=1 Tax=Pedobacter sp. MR2016-19 TaxID=2780089 RepID=UPI0018765989|nr:class I lanthipeptide [Pedobacter sp. MR2016-19]MBE5320465.1 class I lanthipeptide [Pedobacter sp. MR2016-19]
MKSKQLNKNNKFNLDKKTIAKLDQSALGSLNGGAQNMVTTFDIPTSIDSPTTTSFVPGGTTILETTSN